MANLKPYPKYRASETAWLGDIPSHWAVLPNRALFAEVKDRNHADEEMLSVTIAKGVVRQSAILEGTSKKDGSNLDRSAYKLVQPGDITYNKMRAWQGAIGVSLLRGIVSPAYVVMRLHKRDDLPSFFHYLYRTPQFAKEAERWSYGITSDMWSLRPEHFKMIYTPAPPPEEQAAIVSFLEWANGQLNRAIRAKQKVIALLSEQKQAIIDRAVTRGLDSSASLKPSGVPWLHSIPQHWDVQRLKHCITPVEQGWSPQCDAQPAAENEWGVLKVGCVNKDTFSSQQNKKLPPSIHPDSSLEIRDGDILVSRANTRELLGLAALAENPPGKRILCDKLFRFRANANSFNSRFLVYMLRARCCREQIESSTNGASSSMQNIGQDVLRNLWVFKPSVAEQVNIVTYIAAATQPANIAISRFEREIALLCEYRTCLVTDLITGKLDAREAVANLPAEIPDIEAEPSANRGGEIDSSDEETVN